MISIAEIEAACLEHGLLMRGPAPQYALVHAPILLDPVHLPTRAFEKICRIMPVWNRVIDKVARDINFLQEALRETAASDVAFTGRLLEQCLRVYGNRSAAEWPQAAMLGIFRSDYLPSITASGVEFKHVEINTISCSFAGLSPKVADVQGHICRMRGLKDTVLRSASLSGCAKALAQAHELWVRTHEGVAEQPVVVFVVQEGERNTSDQYALHLGLLDECGVHAVRLSLGEIRDRVTLSTDGNAKFSVEGLGNTQVRCVATVFYFRCSYTPNDFPSEKQWEARLLVEQSNAIKCPSLPYHLCTFKRIQQVLSDKNTLRRFVAAPGMTAEEIEQQTEDVFATFALQYCLNDQSSKSAREDAIAHPEAYVMKPQLEGGGNLFYGDKMQELLRLTPEQDAEAARKVRQEYILMQRIRSQHHQGTIMRDGKAVLHADLESEVGTYGVVLATPDAILDNRYVGYLVRSKPATFSDGGVMAGVACLGAATLDA